MANPSESAVKPIRERQLQLLLVKLFKSATISDRGQVKKQRQKTFQEDLATYQADVDAARKLISVGSQPPDEKQDPSELAAWTMLANLILNLDEVVTKN